MHGEPFVQVQAADAVQLGDVDELVARLVLVDQAGLGADGPRRDGEQRADARCDEEPAATEQSRAGEGRDQRCGEKRPARPDRRDQDERGEERPEEAADRGQRVELPGHGPRVAHVVDRQPDREGSDHPEQGQCRCEEREHGEERADRGTGRHLVETVHGNVEERPGRERDDGDQYGPDDDDPTQHARARMPVRDLPADPVADREGREHEADDVRPDDGRAPVVGREEARGADLGRQCSGSGAEHERVQGHGEASPLSGLGRPLLGADRLGHSGP
jgi:hypothetical protein